MFPKETENVDTRDIDLKTAAKYILVFMTAYFPAF